MNNLNWVKEFNAAVTITDNEGKIIYMNNKSLDVFKDDGGEKLIGQNVMDCHSAPSRRQLEDMMKNEATNVYTIEKNGKKKLIYQAPWYENKVYKGLVELSLEIPFDMPHFVRQ